MIYRSLIALENTKRCKKCPLCDVGKVGKSSCHTCHITYADEWHRARLEFESSEEFKRKLNTRHRKEEKNREMKTAHRLRRADSVGLFAM